VVVVGLTPTTSGVAKRRMVPPKFCFSSDAPTTATRCCIALIHCRLLDHRGILPSRVASLTRPAAE
jgi:hypothetical protein